MQNAIKNAIEISRHENRTVVCEIDRNGMNNAALSVEVDNVWESMIDADNGGTDWDDDKDGGARFWGWSPESKGGESEWTIIIR